MNKYTHQTAPTQFVEAAGIRFAYRRFGAKIDIPLLFFMHFTGTMDHWDPALTDGFAHDREVILFNNAGISSSSGEVPTSIEEMAQHAAAFTDALGIEKLDALGFSMGGLIAQQFSIGRPNLVRKLILVGTGATEVGRSGERSLRLPQEDHSAHARRERQQRRDRLHGEFFHSPAESTECAAHSVPR